MRICHLSWEYPPVTYGGLGRHVTALTRAQAALGHAVTVITQRPPGTPVREVIHGVDVVRCEQVTPAVPRDVVGLMAWTAALDQNLAQVTTTGQVPRPDVIHAHDWVVERAATAARLAWDRALVTTIHATEAGRHAGWIVGEISESVYAAEWRLARTSNLVITCSRPMAAEARALYSLGPESIMTIPNGIDLAAWRASADGEPPAEAGVNPALGLGLKPHGPVITFVGRLEWEKGVQVLIEAARQLASLPDATFVIAGTGTQATRFRELAAGDPRIHFIGHASDTDVRRLLARSDAVALPSLYEPFGLVALEAAATGAPLIVSAVGGLAEVVRDGVTGRVVPANDPRALAAAIAELVGDQSAARARAAALAAELPTRYAWSTIAEQTVGAYEVARSTAPHQNDAAEPPQTSGQLLSSGW